MRFLAGETGTTQFLDIGTGLPTMGEHPRGRAANAPQARIVYLDNDPLVDPGVVPITQRRRDTIDIGKVEPIDAYGAVARKP